VDGHDSCVRSSWMESVALGGSRIFRMAEAVAGAESLRPENGPQEPRLVLTLRIAAYVQP
jgi:hypothetical protein